MPEPVDELLEGDRVGRRRRRDVDRHAVMREVHDDLHAARSRRGRIADLHVDVHLTGELALQVKPDGHCRRRRALQRLEASALAPSLRETEPGPLCPGPSKHRLPGRRHEVATAGPPVDSPRPE